MFLLVMIQIPLECRTRGSTRAEISMHLGIRSSTAILFHLKSTTSPPDHQQFIEAMRLLVLLSLVRGGRTLMATCKTHTVERTLLSPRVAQAV